jgi:putative oxidoreductase
MSAGGAACRERNTVALAWVWLPLIPWQRAGAALGSEVTMKKFFFTCFLEWPEKIGSRFGWLAPLLARLVVGWIFAWRGWNDVHGHTIAAEFGQWGSSHEKYLSPVIAGIELAGGIFLLMGFLTRFFAGLLAVIMIIVLIATHRSVFFHSMTDFVNLKETQYLALFLWLFAIGAGKIALDNLIKHK